MLQTIRDRAQGWFAWIIVSLLILVFAVWGIGSYFAPDPDPVIVDVNGQETHWREFQREMAQTRQRLRDRLGSRYDDQLFPAELLQQQVVERFINQALLRDMSKNNGMRIGDAQLAAAIRSYKAFQSDGRFSVDRYRQALDSQGLSEAGFEQRLRNDETIGQVETGVVGSEFATTSEVSRGLALLDQTRTLSHIDFHAADFIDGIEIDSQDLEDYYQQHLPQFSNPEKVTVDYLELNLDALADKVSVPEEQLQQRYKKDAKSTFTTPETRKARHILVEVAADADDAAVAAAEQKLAVIQQRLADGEAFDVVAKETSDDPGSAANGGDLGFVSRGAMVPAFDKAVFSMPLKTVSKPVRTPFGFHIIEVTEVRGGEVKPYSEVRDELLHEIQVQEAESQFYELGETLANVSYEQPDSLEPAAEAVGLTIQHVGPFARDSGEGIAKDPVFAEAAFRSDLIASGTNSEVLELGPTRAVVMRIVDHQPATPKPLDEVRSEVESAVRQAKAGEEAARLGKALIEQLNNGADPKQLADEHGREWIADGEISRSDKKLSSEVRQALFSVAPPAKGSAGSFTGTRTGTSDYVLLWISAVSDSDVGNADAVKKEQMAATLARIKGQAEYAALLASLRKAADIKVFTQNIP